MWNWTIIFDSDVTEQLEMLNPRDRHEIESALETQYWPQHTLKKAMGRIGTSFWPITSDNYRILCYADEQTKTIRVMEITFLDRIYGSSV